MSLDEFEETATDALGSTPGLKINLANGDFITIPHPLLVSDETQERIERVQRRDDLDPKPMVEDPETGQLVPDPAARDLIDGEPAPVFNVRFALALLGDEAHARFLAAGGSSNKVLLAWQYLTEGLQAPKLPR
ncbi:hypothetical protein [Gordonia sp. N1V]|uniref:hypothetical protein n=1 Tax=Gordonia sp. N1V TaxID=3034163 RepID=UPI0023E1C015|nr:hypothetical protein [Gordonia sp. N1V]MDF3280924.1 hypothetical protein [Gordonia sp. N1V]